MAYFVVWIAPFLIACIPGFIMLAFKSRKLGALLCGVGCAAVLAAWIALLVLVSRIGPNEDPGPGIIAIAILPLLASFVFAGAGVVVIALIWLVKWYIGPPIAQPASGPNKHD